MIAPEFIRELSERVDLADLIGSYVKLERRGVNWVGLCPFHNEKTPSFNVHATKGFYHCFGCGASGNAIGFIQQHEGADFVSAVEKLAAMQGMTVVRQGKSGDGGEASSNVSSLLTEAMEYFQKQLRDAKAAKDYLKGRGMSGEIAKQYKIGYAPDQWEGIGKALQQPPALLAAAGVLRQKNDKYRDYFRDRIIFPIIDGGGRVCGFGGRALAEDNQPKYLNSAENRYFSKRRLLFGMPQAMKAAQQKKRLIICEGYMDVVMLAQGGFSEAVATMGTAATAEQMRKAARLAPNIYFAYDGDEAGQKGAARALQGILPALKDGISIFFLFLPAGYDPDSYVTEKGSAAFEELLTNAKPLGDYLLEMLYEQSQVQGDDGQAVSVMKAGSELLQLLDRRQAPLWFNLLENKLKQKTGVSVTTVNSAGAKASSRSVAKDKYTIPSQSVLFNLLCCLVIKPALIESLPADLPFPGATADQVQAMNDILSMLRWGLADDDDDDEEASVGMLKIISQNGYRTLALRLYRSIRNRYAHAPDVEAELKTIVQKLKKKHENLVQKQKILDQMKTQKPSGE